MNHTPKSPTRPEHTLAPNREKQDIATVNSEFRASFEEALFPHLEALWGTALWLTSHQSFAENLLLATVSQAYRLWVNPVHGASHRIYLFRIMVSESSRVGPETAASRRNFGELPCVADDAKADGRSQRSGASVDRQDLQILSQISGSLFKGAATRLSPQSRLIMILHLREQMSYADIAYITDLQVDIVSTTITRLSRLIPQYLVKRERYKRRTFGGDQSALDASNDSWENEGGSVKNEYQEQIQ